MNGYAAPRLAALMLCVTAMMASPPAGAGAVPVPDSVGTDFWLAFPRNYTERGYKVLYIAADAPATVTVTVTRPSYSTTVAVTPGFLTEVPLPQPETLFAGYGGSVHLRADTEVAVFGLSRMRGSSDSFLALPTDALGTRYTVMAWGAGVPFPGFPQSEFAIVA